MDAFQFAAPQGGRKFAAVQSIGLHSLFRCSRHHWRRHHQAGIARRLQVIIEPKSGRPGFVNKGQSLSGKLFPHKVQQLARTIGQPQRLQQSLVIGDSRGDAMMVDIEPHEHLVIARHKHLRVN